jgi:hypothetical protein
MICKRGKGICRWHRLGLGSILICLTGGEIALLLGVERSHKS